jgi:hypothetical protein
LVPQAVSSATGAHCQFDPAVQLWQAPLQLPAQQCPPTQDPDWHSMPSVQVAPGPFLVQVPPWQVLPPPQSVPSGRSAHIQLLAAVHERQAPEQAPAQQWPATQTFDWQSAPATQLSPRPFFAGGVQRSMAHTCPIGQGSITIWQAPAAVQARRVRVVPLQVAAPQEAPSRSRRQPPLPSQPLLQASFRQLPVGSAPPAGTGAQVPSEPSTLHAWQLPLQAVAQHRPWAQMPGAAQSASRVHRAPTGRLPHEPSTQALGGAHCESLPHWPTQRAPLQPW